jgi:2-dehydro-3-deoxygluconokinase
LLNIKPKSECSWDIVSLGEVMLRFDPGDERIRTARSFRVYEGGGEYNVARNLAKCFGLDAAIVTALADNDIGRLVEDLIAQGRVDTSRIIWRWTDGICREVRNGMYFWERGHGMRPPSGCSDRGNTAVSKLRPGDIAWQDIFGKRGTRWFHTGGIFAGLSETTAEVAAEAMQAARESGSIVSYDLNYRDSLWSARGGREAANEVNRRLLDLADIVFGVNDFDAALSTFDEVKFREAAGQMVCSHASLKIVATPLRTVHNASRHDLSSVCFSEGRVFRGPTIDNIDVLDRVGSGDAFAAGLIYEVLSGRDSRSALRTATAAAALALCSPGDNLDLRAEELASLIDEDAKYAR